LTDIHIQFHYKLLSITSDDDLVLRLDVEDLTSDLGDLRSYMGISNWRWESGDPPGFPQFNP